MRGAGLVRTQAPLSEDRGNRVRALRGVPPRRAGFPLASLLRPSPARAAGFASAGWRASGASVT